MLSGNYEDTDKKKSKIISDILIFSIFFTGFYYVPILLVWFGVIPFEFRFYVLVAITVFSAIYSFLRRHSLYDLGFRLDNIKYALFLNGILILFVLIILTAFCYSKNTTGLIIPGWSWFNGFYVLISAPSQEFLFRSVLFAELRKINVNRTFSKIALTTVTYCFLHIIYNDLLTLLATLFMGTIWGIIYNKTDNFWGIALSHAVLGAVSISIGLI